MYQNILVPVALDHDHGANTQTALNIARSLCDDGGKITLLHVTEPLHAEVSQYIPAEVLEGNKASLIADLRQLAGDMENARTEVLPGSAGITITDYAKQHKADLIIVASHRPGLRDYFLGSTAARVVRHANCAVHVVR
jgi:nucleotide-binding universal stress UspA family protein